MRIIGTGPGDWKTVEMTDSEWGALEALGVKVGVEQCAPAKHLCGTMPFNTSIDLVRSGRGGWCWKVYPENGTSLAITHCPWCGKELR